MSIVKAKEDAAYKGFSSDEMDVLFKVSKMLRVELLNCSGREGKFEGQFVNFQLPVLLRTFVRWLLFGTKDIRYAI